MGDNTRKGDNRLLLMALRQALLIALGAIEEYLGMERSVLPKHERAKQLAPPGNQRA